MNIEGQNPEPKKIIGWKIYYADGTKICGKTRQDWDAAPNDGVQCIMIYSDRFDTTGTIRYRTVMASQDYYFMAAGVKSDFIACNNNTDNEVRYPGCSIKKGQWTDEENFDSIFAGAMNDYNVTELGVTPEAGTSDK